MRLPDRRGRGAVIVGPILAFAVLVAAPGTTAHAQCEPSASVRALVERSYLRHVTGLSREERAAKRTAILKAGLAGHPDDYFLLRQLLAIEENRDARILWSRSLLDTHPDLPVYVLLHARALEGRDTPAAVRMLESLRAAHPKAARAFLQLADLAGSGKFKDKEKAQRELAGFLELCPAPLDAGALEVLTADGTTQQLARTAPALRQRLQAESDPLLSEIWQELWSMEFKVRPPSEHAGVRQQIARDLQRFETVPQRHELDWLAFLQQGYGSVNDPAALARVEEEILAAHPGSDVAEDLVLERWSRRHRYPIDRDKAKIEAFLRARLAAAEEWRKRWPGEAFILDIRFAALDGLHESTPDQIAGAADELLNAYRKYPSFFGSSPVEFDIAEAFLKHGIRLDQVPALVEEGYRAAAARHRRRLDDDRAADESRLAAQRMADHLRLDRMRVLLAYYAAVKQPEKAAAIAAELAAFPVSDPKLKPLVLARRAQAAELAGHKLDALMLYRGAMEAAGAGVPPSDSRDAMAEQVERLWQELGGTPAAHALLLANPASPAAAPQPAEASDTRWERPRNPLPAFSLSDLEGRTWKLASLNGRAVLINVWATWCGPCQAEHPELQKLYERLKSRVDLAVLTFNVDEDLGKVEPYMREHGYTFPVVPARDLVAAVVPVLAIPRNWLIDRQGKLAWEQVGFPPDPRWQEATIAKLEEVLAQPAR